MKADKMLVPLDASPFAEGAPFRPDPDLHACRRGDNAARGRSE